MRINLLSIGFFLFFPGTDLIVSSPTSKTLPLSSFFDSKQVLTPAIAHNVQSDGDVGATFHLEPNHNPRAGETATVWFALTTRGGKIIPLQQCDCKLTVSSQSSSTGKSIVFYPPLKSIDAEQYQDIPGAEIIFPQIGVYQLQITGKAKSGASFQPFTLKYNVTVSPGINNR